MPFFLTATALQIAWWTSVLPYLSSRRQHLLLRPIPRLIGWSGFVVGMLVACWLLTRVHHPSSAIIYWLSVVMVSWVLLVLSIPHFEQKSQVFIWGTGLALLAATLG